MLLRHTPHDETPRQGITINPAKACQPLGATMAALGIYRCLPHSHGSQGCAAYHRSTLSRHFKEPVLATTSSFTEGSSVFGGQGNLLQAIRTAFSVYEPEVLAIHTTCLSETIGDDLTQIVTTAHSEGFIPAGCTVLTASTPSYSGSHVTGFATMTASMASLGEAGPKQRPGQVNVIPGWVEPADVREIKRIFSSFGLEAIVFPDLSYLTERVVEPHSTSSGGGVQIDALRRSGTSELTFALGPTASLAAAKSLDQSCKVPVEPFELPIGLRATDALVHRLHRLTGRPVPEQLQHDRYRLVTLLKRMNQYLYDKRVALFGDPDQLVSLSGFLADAGMKPVFVLSGTPGKDLAKRVDRVLAGRSPEVRIAQGAQADLFTLHQWIKQQPVDLLVGNSYGKYIARDEGIPLVRASFPIFDRTSHQYFPLVGYRGGQYLTDQLINALLDQLDRDCPEEAMELVR